MGSDRSDGMARRRRALHFALKGRRDPASGAGQRRRTSGRLSERHTRKVLDLTIRLAEVMLSSGSGTADVVATAQDVAQAYQLTDCVVDVFVTTIFVSALPTADSPPVTIVRAVQARSTDYTRLADLDRLVRRITSGGVSVDEAHEAMDELSEQPHPYPRWIATAGWAGFALGIAMLLGGTWLTCILAAGTSVLIDRSGRLLNRVGTPMFFQQAAGASIATLVAVAAFLFAGQGPTTLVATGIVMLLAGMTLVGSVQDALTGYMLTAVARLGDVLFLTLGIVVGILAGLQIAALAGIQIQLRVDATEFFVLPTTPEQIVLAVSGAALAGACLVIASYAKWRSVLTAGVAAGLAEAVLIGLGRAGVGQIVATGTAAVGVGLLATLISIRRQAPALVTATAGITPMLPGMAVFRAVFYFAVERDYAAGMAQALAAAATALAIGAGVVMGELAGSPLRYRAGRISDFLRVEGPPGLRRAVGNVVALRPAADQQPSRSPHQRSWSVALEPELSEVATEPDGEDPNPESDATEER
ncbi:threonine/serine ThrE exporter family protein [Mycolicibacterium austroafricanum]|uniref:threonine/serine ThrE exporter family protein n=1 Tax=Mycolicibacterium austroafricanum TaxID=39687 RepID=UPI001CA35BBB|nr:threonine/serine exporter family protein [Mycolicibacterium austroafricanum]QZT62786.1 threonine/serine exporter family protein [Mycolicibacterium austroafricanum]